MHFKGFQMKTGLAMLTEGYDDSKGITVCPAIWPKGVETFIFDVDGEGRLTKYLGVEFWPVALPQNPKVLARGVDGNRRVAYQGSLHTPFNIPK